MVDLNKLIELIFNTESLSHIFETRLKEIKPYYLERKKPFQKRKHTILFRLKRQNNNV